MYLVENGHILWPEFPPTGWFSLEKKAITHTKSYMKERWQNPTNAQTTRKKGIREPYDNSGKLLVD